MNYKSIAIGLVLILGASLGYNAGFVSKKETVSPSSEAIMRAGQAVAQAIVDSAERNPDALGAVTNPDIPSRYLSFGGVRSWAGSMSMNTATSTACSIQAPAATSTLVSATARLDTSASYATRWELSNGATPNASTTRLALMDVAASGSEEIVATTTVTALTDGVVNPLSWINFRVSTTTNPSVINIAPTGVCKAVFREM